MIYLLFGEDSFSRDLKLAELLGGKSAVVWGVGEGEVTAPNILQLATPDLFGGAKIPVCRNCLGLVELEEVISSVTQAGVDCFFVEGKLDKRKKNVGEWLKSNEVKVIEFAGASFSDALNFTRKRSGELGLHFEKNVLEEFVRRVYGDESESTLGFEGDVFSLGVIESELQKFLACAGGEAVTLEMVQSLTALRSQVSGFAISNALVDGNLQRGLDLLRKYLGEVTGADRKARLIQFVGLLAEQWSGMLLALKAKEAGTPDSEILSQTGWKPFRLTKAMQSGRKFGVVSLSDTLRKLIALDEENKSSGVNGEAVLELILIQALGK